jgi:hypothetical protein
MKEAIKRAVNAHQRLVVIWLLCGTLIAPMAIAVGGWWYSRHNQLQSEHHFRQAQKDTEARLQAVQRHAQSDSDRRWCPLLNLVDRPGRPPAATAEEAKARVALHKLRLDLGCPP